MTFLQVTQSLLKGFAVTGLLFILTLLIAIPLGLAICFCSMSRFKPLRCVSKTFVWIIRGVPLMLQLFVIYYLPRYFSASGATVYHIDSCHFTLCLKYYHTGGFPRFQFGECFQYL